MALNGKPGPDAEALKVEGDWRLAMRKALNKTRPAEDWPERPVKKRKPAKKKRKSK